MSKGKTISTRWKEWAKAEPFWSYIALYTMLWSFLGLIVHLAVLEGFLRTAGLVCMIMGAFMVEFILFFRKQWWWLSFWTYVILGVIGWEVASYFFGAR